ncbi:hypothetical protein IQ265_02680 [Nodosilinea sp. LEGE 06152]|uniref:hypothetical protein n=1 Tax=Nodosilinea sp. LEGE 06152 TaxID=2777966 RepID=UPI00188168E7|nr:hypothetical protein [Nodosilinea sp. LEGE 06152]MBE9155740.1 hypothetical protein [Nodosilinea sp. LEGE 06152]
MAPQHSNDRSGRAGDRRQGGFIRWSTPSRRQGQPDRLDPGFVVDRKQLYKYLDSLEGFSGE